MNTITFNHNFCESRLQYNEGPEYYNAITSLFITIIPLITGFPKNTYFKNITYMFILNGFFSCYYHYSLSWFGKHLDEITMIIANYYGIRAMLQFYPKDFQNNINLMNITFMPIFIAFNTIPQYDFLFPHIFFIYVLLTIFLILDLSKKLKLVKTVHNYLLISAIGGISWIISENYCNAYTTYGHVVWHYMFPLGLYTIIVIYDELLDSTTILIDHW